MSPWLRWPLALPIRRRGSPVCSNVTVPTWLSSPTASKFERAGAIGSAASISSDSGAAATLSLAASYSTRSAWKGVWDCCAYNRQKHRHDGLTLCGAQVAGCCGRPPALCRFHRDQECPTLWSLESNDMHQKTRILTSSEHNCWCIFLFIGIRKNKVIDERIEE